MLNDHIFKAAIAALFMLILSACAQPKPLYIYDDYSESYYHNKKTVTEENRLKLEASMEKAIENSPKSLSGRVAPGMYANLGYMYLQEGDAKKALSNFEKEKQIYPEATLFMDRIISKVVIAEGDQK